MKSGDRIYTVNHIRGGQPRPYADSYYEFTITFQWVNMKGEVEPWNIPETMTDKIAKAIGHYWRDKGEGDWASPRLTSKKMDAPGVWRFLVTEPFTD